MRNFFTNFANYRLFAKILSANVLVFVDKDRAIALIRENIIREMRICKKILPRKFPAIRYAATRRHGHSTQQKTLLTQMTFD